MPEMGGLSGHIEIAPGVTLPAGRLDFAYSRSSGPGGQNVNKLNTRATLTVALDDLAEPLHPAALRRLRDLAGQYLADDRLVISSQEHRSQIANRDECLEKLRHLIVRARARPKKRRPTQRTRGSIERRLGRKKQRGQIKRTRQKPDRDAHR